MKQVINGLNLNIETWGSPKKPKLFLLHGWLDMGMSFAWMAEWLKDDFYCIAPDFRGMGRSEHSPSALGYFFYEYVADLHALFAHFSPDQPVRCLGHSMGGNVLSLYAGTFPERVSHLINVEGFGLHNMAPELGPSRMREWIETQDGQRFRVFPSLARFAKRLGEANPRLPPERALFLARHITRRTKQGYVMAADPRHKRVHPHLFHLQDVTPFWRNIQAKCLLVWTDQTNMDRWMKSGEGGLDRELETRLAYFPKDSQRAVLKDCGHMVHHEQPEALARLVLKFL